MQISDTEKHERVLSVSLDREQVEAILERAIAERTGVCVDLLRQHGRLKIMPNMLGSPEYQSGYRATLVATIPLGEGVAA